MNKVIGKGEFQRNIRRYTKDLYLGAYYALSEIGTLVKSESQARTPVDTGFLKASQFKQALRGTIRSGPSVRIGSPPEAHYAPYVHENLEIPHRVGQAKFLEAAINDNMTRIKGIFESHIERASSASLAKIKVSKPFSGAPSLTAGGVVSRFFAPTIPDPRQIFANTARWLFQVQGSM